MLLMLLLSVILEVAPVFLLLTVVVLVSVIRSDGDVFVLAVLQGVKPLRAQIGCLVWFCAKFLVYPVNVVRQTRPGMRLRGP